LYSLSAEGESDRSPATMPAAWNSSPQLGSSDARHRSRARLSVCSPSGRSCMRILATAVIVAAETVNSGGSGPGSGYAASFWASSNCPCSSRALASSILNRRAHCGFELLNRAKARPASPRHCTSSPRTSILYACSKSVCGELDRSQHKNIRSRRRRARDFRDDCAHLPLPLRPSLSRVRRSLDSG